MGSRMQQPPEQSLMPDAMPDAANKAGSGMAQQGNRMQQSVALLFHSRGRVATAVLVTLSLLIVYFVIFDKDGLAAYEQKRHQTQVLQQEINALQQENQQMAMHNQRLLNDPDTIEHEAREQLHYTRSGEIIYMLPEAPHSNAATQKSAK